MTTTPTVDVQVTDLGVDETSPSGGEVTAANSASNTVIPSTIVGCPPSNSSKLPLPPSQLVTNQPAFSSAPPVIASTMSSAVKPVPTKTQVKVCNCRVRGILPYLEIVSISLIIGGFSSRVAEVDALPRTSCRLEP